MIASIEPQDVWTFFAALCRIPRPPRGEERVLAFVRRWADDHGLAHEADAAGNTVIRVPATAGRADAPTVILQAHVDMVCERTADAAGDPAVEGVDAYRDDRWVRARGTTLGADDGIGVAAAMALATAADVPHGPLELLFTTAEEVGLEGARALDGSMLRGRLLLNLDSEEDGTLTIGCAGATDTWLRIEADRAAASGVGLRVAVRGGRGGHSGTDALAGHANAIHLLGGVLAAARADAAFHLVALDGGRSRNAIPRDAAAVVATTEPDALRAAIAAAFAPVRTALATTDPALELAIDAVDDPADAWTEAGTTRLLGAIAGHPSGVLAMSPTVPGLAETSISIGVATTDGRRLELHALARSSDDAAMDALVASLEATAATLGATLEHRVNYRGWQPDPTSPLLAATKAAYRRAFGTEPTVGGIHAGLECAVIGARVPGLDMVSFGPTIEAPHGPDERILVETVGRFRQLLAATLDELSRPTAGPSA